MVSGCVDGHHRPMTTDQPDATTAPPRPTARPIRRRGTNRVLGGVASGIGDYFNIDPLIVRAVFVGLMIFGGAGLVLYVGAWLLIRPRASRTRRSSRSCAASASTQRRPRSS